MSISSKHLETRELVPSIIECGSPGSSTHTALLPYAWCPNPHVLHSHFLSSKQQTQIFLKRFLRKTSICALRKVLPYAHTLSKQNDHVWGAFSLFPSTPGPCASKEQAHYCWWAAPPVTAGQSHPCETDGLESPLPVDISIAYSDSAALF